MKHEIFEAKEVDPHTNSDVFLDFAPDINGGGWPDVLIYSWLDKGACWLENPKGGTADWSKHPIMDVVDGDGKPDFIEKRGWWKNPGKEGEWTLHPIPFKDNGDGFPDFLTANKKGTFIHIQKRVP